MKEPEIIKEYQVRTMRKWVELGPNRRCPRYWRDIICSKSRRCVCLRDVETPWCWGCADCERFFPKVSRGMKENSDNFPCPCDLYGKEQVVKMAKKYIRGWEEQSYEQ